MFQFKFQLRFCIVYAALGLSGVLLCSNQVNGQIDGNQSIASGNWFNDLIWQDEFGNNDRPRGNDNHTNTHISNGNVVQIGNGLAETSVNLIVGDFDGGLPGAGRLEVTGSGSLSVGSFLFIAGSENSAGSVLFDTTGTIEGNIRVGRFSDSLALLEMRNGTFTGNLDIGFLSAGARVDFSGGTINAQGLTDGIFIRTNGVLNQTGGQLNVNLGDFSIANDGIYIQSGGTANLQRDFSSSGEAAAFSNNAQFVVAGDFGSDTDTLISDSASVQADRFNFNGNSFTRISGGTLTATGTNGFINFRAGEFLATDGVVDVENGLFVIGEDNLSTFMSFSGNSRLEAGSLTIGSDNRGDVEFVIDNNAVVDIAGDISMGLAGNNNRMKLINGTLDADTFFAGVSSDAEVIFQSGTVDLNGFVIGVEGSSTVSLTDDANLSVFGPTIIGQQSGGFGRLETQLLTNLETGQLQVGVSGQGEIEFGEFSSGKANDATFVGVNADGVGTMTVTDSARFDSLNNIFIGRDGKGVLNVNAEGKITGQQLQIARNANSIGDVRISDVATADFNGIFLALNGAGTLTLEGDSTTTTTFLSIAQGAGANGSLDLTNNAQLNVTDNFLVASANVESTATVTINDNAIVNVAGDSSTGNVRGNATFNVNGGQVNIANNANFGGSSSTTEFNMNAGQFTAENVRFDGFSPATTSNTLNMNGGTLRATNNIEFQRGIIANISDGAIESDQQMIFGNDSTAASRSVLINQTGGTVHSKVDIDIRGEGETLYNLSGGTLSAEQDVLFGNVDTVSAEFNQEGGTMNVGRNLINRNVVHEVTGGNLNVAGTINVGDTDNDSSASFEQTGGIVDATFGFNIENAFGDFRGGKTRTEQLTIGNLVDEFLVTEVTVSGTAEIITNQIRLETAGGAESSLVLSDDALIETDSLIINDSGLSSATDFFHQGGELRVNSIEITGDGIYGLSDGVLTSREGDLDIVGNLFITRFGEIKFRDEMTIEISNQFAAFDLFGDGNVGKLNFSEYGRLGLGSGYVKLIGVGDNSNLLSGEALDNLELIGVLEGQQLTEQEFIDAMANGSFVGASYALVEGTHFGEAGSIGIAFANFTTVPEPRATWLLLVSLVLILMNRFRRTTPAVAFEKPRT